MTAAKKRVCPTCGGAGTVPHDRYKLSEVSAVDDLLVALFRGEGRLVIMQDELGTYTAIETQLRTSFSRSSFVPDAIIAQATDHGFLHQLASTTAEVLFDKIVTLGPTMTAAGNREAAKIIYKLTEAS